MVVIETDDLLLRSWQADDRQAYDEHCNNNVVMKWLGGKQTKKQLNEDVDWFEHKERKFGCTFWVLQRKSDKAFLGWCGLVVVEDGDDASESLVGELEIGWRLRQDVQGLGYAKRASAEVMEFAFDCLKAKRVISTASQGNVKSVGLMTRLGMRHDYARDFGEPGDHRTVVYTIDWDKWNKADVFRPRKL